MQVPSLDQKDPLEKGMATHSSILAGKSHGQRSLTGYSPWDHKELDMIERLIHTHKMLSPTGLIIVCLDLFFFFSLITLNSEYLKGTNHILFISTTIYQGPTVCQTLYTSRTLDYWKEHWTGQRLVLALPLVE